MDKNYLDTLKKIDLRPGKVKVKESKEEVLMEEKTNSPSELLKEIFIQAGEIEKMPKGKDRDLQILRLSMIAEIDAINLYMRFANLAQDGNIKKVMIHVANEEKVHIGEFETMMEYLDPEFEKFEEEGEQEVADETGLDVSD